MKLLLPAFLGPLVLAGCAAGAGLPASPPGVVLERITVTSRSFSSGASIPVDLTCDGKNTSPDVTWSSPPEGTRSLVITMDDLEASTGRGTRWIVMDVRPEARSLPAGADASAVGARLGRNDSGEVGYSGPCPARHVAHHYSLRVIALDRPVGLAEAASREQLDAALEGHVLGFGDVTFVASR